MNHHVTCHTILPFFLHVPTGLDVFLGGLRFPYPCVYPRISTLVDWDELELAAPTLFRTGPRTPKPRVALADLSLEGWARWEGKFLVRKFQVYLLISSSLLDMFQRSSECRRPRCRKFTDTYGHPLVSDNVRSIPAIEGLAGVGTDSQTIAVYVLRRLGCFAFEAPVAVTLTWSRLSWLLVDLWMGYPGYLCARGSVPPTVPPIIEPGNIRMPRPEEPLGAYLKLHIAGVQSRFRESHLHDQDYRSQTKMGLSVEQVRALADAVARWRMQEVVYHEYVYLDEAVSVIDQRPVPFYALYVYYVLLSLDEEVSVIFPHRWNRGKMLFVVIRYGTLAFLTLDLTIGVGVAPRGAFFSSRLAIVTRLARLLRLPIIPRYICAFSPVTVRSAFILFAQPGLRSTAALALCLGALLQVRRFYLLGIAILALGPRIIGDIFELLADIQYPAEPVSGIFKELGYPCYVPSNEQWIESQTLWGLGREIREYLTFATTAALFILAGATFTVRYKGHKGRLVHVLGRDGGLYFIALACIRFGVAITSTPAILEVSRWDSSPVAILVTVSNDILIPIAAQRLMINLRKVDYMGERPLASRLLFSPPLPGSECDEDEGDLDYFEMSFENEDVRCRAVEGSIIHNS
ncbi:hypothetical protein NMY22_g8327 [Coprinellus aureogranulatus]|nr:hypothetical protein NMY22_g8327 [Coprinellus aureogranulatus]